MSHPIIAIRLIGREAEVVTQSQFRFHEVTPASQKRIETLAYLAASHTAIGTEVFALVRDKRVAMTVTALPFVPNRYHRG